MKIDLDFENKTQEILAKDGDRETLRAGITAALREQYERGMQDAIKFSQTAEHLPSIVAVSYKEIGNSSNKIREGEMIICPQCNGFHEVQLGTMASLMKTDGLGFIKCADTSLLVSFEGALLWAKKPAKK